MKTFKIFYIFSLLVLSLSVYILLNSILYKKDIYIATGNRDGAYFKYAKEYKRLLKEEGIELHLEDTDGSVEAQGLLLSSKVDFAFVQGGTEKEGIKALANVAYEPIWIFFKDERLNSLRALKHKRVAIGQEGSGIYPVAKELLTTVDIDINTSNFKKLKSRDALKELKSGELDALFYVGSDMSPLVKGLMKQKNIHLMDFDKAEAYSQYSLGTNTYYECLTLKKYGFDYKKHVPIKSHMMLAKTTLVATNDNTSDEMVRLMLKVMEKVHSKAGMFHKENTFPNVSKLKLSQHPASENYFEEKQTFLEKHFSFWFAQTLQGLYTVTLFILLPFITIFGFIVEVIIPSYAHYSRVRINKWYHLVNEIDTDIDELTKTEMEEKIEFLNSLLREVRAADDIPAIHMGSFYSLQNQIVSIIEDLERKLK